MKRLLLPGLFIALNVNAWDGTGHMLVAQIARDHMSSQAVARVDAIAATLDNNGTPYNGVSIACWPDDIKDKNSKSPHQGQFKPWHYIDTGCLPGDPDVLASRPALTATKGDVITAMDHCVELLRKKRTDELVPSEAVALGLLIHFVGDVHQPLHTTSRHNPHPKAGDKYKNDAGGNGVTVANLVDTPWPKNLHTFWDESYRRYFEKGEVKALPQLDEATALGSPEMAEWIKRLTGDAPGKPVLQFDAKQWVLESHGVACAFVYGKLGEPYGARDITLREDYVAESTKIARRQIVLAGYRLGALLESLYGH